VTSRAPPHSRGGLAQDVWTAVMVCNVWMGCGCDALVMAGDRTEDRDSL